VLIEDVQIFFDTIVEKYFQSLNDYAIKTAAIKTKRSVTAITSL
jgi:hypothetical protein